MQEAWIQSGLGRFHMPGAAKPVRGNYWAHALQLLELLCLESVFHNKGSHGNKNPILSNYLLTATRESLHSAMKTQHNQK